MTGVNLAKDVSILKNRIEVYEDESEKPDLGRKLNQPALLTFFDVQPRKSESVEDCKARLKAMIENNGGEFISYDGRKWEFKVPSM